MKYYYIILNTYNPYNPKVIEEKELTKKLNLCAW